MGIEQTELAVLHGTVVGQQSVDQLIVFHRHPDIVLPAVVVPADADAREQAHRVFLIESNAHIGDVEAKIPAAHRTDGHQVVGTRVGVHARWVEEHIQACLEAVPMGIEEEVSFLATFPF